jgi:hypothetical protein
VVTSPRQRLRTVEPCYAGGVSLAAHIGSYLAVAVGGSVVGYAVGLARHGAVQNARIERSGIWVKETEDPGLESRPTGSPNGYGVTEVAMQCIKPSCRRLNPDADVVLVGVGLSGSAYHCRHCKESW